MNNDLNNKQLYKIFLWYVKFLPNMLFLLKIIGLTLNYFKIKSFLITCFGGTSILILVLLYLISFTFKFCGTHRVSIYYITIIHIITMVDYFIGIPISVDNLFSLYGIVTGIFIMTWLVTWYKNRNNPKTDHIKNLCDKFVDCNYN